MLVFEHDTPRGLQQYSYESADAKTTTTPPPKRDILHQKMIFCLLDSKLVFLMYS